MQQHFQDFSENGVWPGLANESHGGREDGRRKVFLSCLLLFYFFILFLYIFFQRLFIFGTERDKA